MRLNVALIHLMLGCSGSDLSRTIEYDASCDEVCQDWVRGGMNVWNMQVDANLTERDGYRVVRVFVADDCGGEWPAGLFTSNTFGPDTICLRRSTFGLSAGRYVAVHELGHALGVKTHTDGRGDAMSEMSGSPCLTGKDIALFCAYNVCTGEEWSCDR